MKRIIGLIILFSSCQSAPTETEVKNITPKLELVRTPSIQFPTTPYDSMALFSVSPKYYSVEDIQLLEQEIMNAPYTDGLAIVDSTGTPSGKHYTRYSLSDREQAELKAIFHLPPNNGEVIKTTCIPIYRDVLVFYKNRKQIAQAQICLHCNQAYLTPETGDVTERFSTDVDWNRLETFIKGAKLVKAAANTSLLP